MTAEPHSALRWLHEYGRRYPWAWNSYAQLLSAMPAKWPSWCYCPLAGAYAVLSQGGTLAPELGLEVGSLGALAAWRATQGIYRFYPTLLEELLATPVDGDIPADMLLRMPEWCVYVETPTVEQVAGFFAFVEHDANTGRAELRLLLDLTETRMLVPQIVHLGRGSLRDGLRAAVNEARVVALSRGVPEAVLQQVGDAVPGDAERLERLLSVLLYLCADDSEVPRSAATPERVVRGRKRPILPTPKHGVRVHDCGLRLGAALDLAKAQHHSTRGGSGTSVTPHIRRAHWHTYWIGARDGERSTVVRWLPPIAVKLDDVPTVAVVRPVGEHDVDN